MKIKADKLVSALKERGILKTQEILQLGISKEYLRKLKEKGVVEKIARGVYVLPSWSCRFDSDRPLFAPH